MVSELRGDDDGDRSANVRGELGVVSILMKYVRAVRQVDPGENEFRGMLLLGFPGIL